MLNCSLHLDHSTINAIAPYLCLLSRMAVSQERGKSMFPVLTLSFFSSIAQPARTKVKPQRDLDQPLDRPAAILQF